MHVLFLLAFVHFLLLVTRLTELALTPRKPNPMLYIPAIFGFKNDAFAIDKITRQDRVYDVSWKVSG